MRRSPLAWMLMAIVVLSLVGRCVGPLTTTTPTTPGGEDPTPFGWATSSNNRRVQTGDLEVPLDHDDTSKGTITLHVARHLAKPELRIGSLLVNPGGPGVGGTRLALAAEKIYTSRLLDRFDIVAWDPRGTGQSEPHIDCVDDYDRYYAGVDLTPESDEERQYAVDLAEEFTDACVRKNERLLQYVGTNNSARDMDVIRRALGEESISYFGFSYGSELGAVWATMFPSTVRAAVLDGATDPNAGSLETSLQQAEGFEHTFTSFLEWCDSDRSCAFHGGSGATTAFDALMLRLDESPVPSEEGRPDVNLSVAVTAIAMAMYSDRTWPQLAAALDDAEQGDGAGLLRLYDAYLERGKDGSFSNTLEAFQTIRCMDSVDRPSVAEDDARTTYFCDVSPRLAPATIGSYFCTFFPPTTDPRIAVSGGTSVPIVVVGTTGDPATPLDSSRAMAAALGGRFVVVSADQHTGYRVNDCIDDAVDQYLVDPIGNVPADGLTCD